MTSQSIEGKLRRFLLLMAVLVFLATLAELVLAEHTKEPLQFLPFILCAIGLVVVVTALLRPRRSTLIALRWIMALVALGGLFGISVHLLENLEFAREIRPNAALANVVIAGLKGAAPLLAPGTLVFAALLALGATYSHPALARRNPDSRTS